MLEGITAGFIFSLTLFPGAVWLAKVGVSGTRRQVVAVGAGFWLSHLFWLLVAVPGLRMMSAHLPFIRFGMHLFAAFVLVYMAFKFFRSKRVERVDDAPVLPGTWDLLHRSFGQSLAMPMRLPAAMAILLATGAYINHPPEWAVVPGVLFGAFIGVTWWWGQFVVLSVYFAKRVPQPITIKSLNKIRPFCAVLCLCLSGIVLYLGL
ncbi:LysE family transporter [Coraliomargarita algicola]|uniref:LysE family transporter n=1 Tax=Coraliomargarita algicola TaxID=3092156 RepID=A0ABZ0RJ05_9BACT|nr:LysE family transporter [Coraliomargarita sp. J2-16]WPJ94775.1 LysE family transporter [Coraliomargarita sp. J2-16]